MYDFSKLYYPITARPAEASEYLPVPGLRPYIRCFWGTGEESVPHKARCSYIEPTEASSKAGPEVIIPDSCMDIIWEWDRDSGEEDGIFCGINDAPFISGQAGQPGSTSIFAIRFHFWGVHLFADDHLREVLNVHADVEQYFSSFRRELGSEIRNTHSVAERVVLAEAYLLRRLERKRHSHDGLLNAIYTILKAKGVISAGELERSSGLGSRQLERLFREYTGVTPKKAADLVRFQNVWGELYSPAGRSVTMQDLVFNYSYSHQSHMINNFRKYAGMTPLEALRYAGR